MYTRVYTYSNAYSIFGCAISARPARSRRDRSRGSLFYARFLYSMHSLFFFRSTNQTRVIRRAPTHHLYPLKTLFLEQARDATIFHLDDARKRRTPFLASVFFAGHPLDTRAPCIHAANNYCFVTARRRRFRRLNLSSNRERILVATNENARDRRRIDAGNLSSMYFVDYVSSRILTIHAAGREISVLLIRRSTVAEEISRVVLRQNFDNNLRT